MVAIVTDWIFCKLSVLGVVWVTVTVKVDLHQQIESPQDWSLAFLGSGV